MPSKKTKTATATATTPASAPKETKTTPASAPKETKTASASAPKETKTTPASAPKEVKSSDATTAETVSDITDSSTTQELVDSYNESIAEKWKQINALQAAIRNEMRAMDKLFGKELKAYGKILKKKESRNKATKEKKGIAELRTVSNELAAFIKRPEGTKMTSSEVTSIVCKYVKEHKLNDSKAGNKFYPDEKLRTLLGVAEGTVVVSVGASDDSGIHLQTALKKHFQSNTAA
jgi:chromatin remodeling complex protein RSC6